MKVGIIGAGPAGLYAAIAIKRVRPDAEIRIYEQSPANATWGFGVVFSDRALEFLRGDDPETADLIEPHMETWSDIAIVHKGQRIAIDGVGFSAIGRLEMLKLLQRRAAELGVAPIFETRVDDLSIFDGDDLVIAADGLNSVIRAAAPDDFGEALYELGNRFVWYGTNKPFKTLTQTFRQTAYGPFNVHHYRFDPDQSTFLIECSPQAFEKAGFETMSEPEYRAICERLFAPELEGAKLIGNNSIWRRFPVLSCARWHIGNRVLVGDALHTAHYSIGSGTRLAMEDVTALVRALEQHDFDVAKALPAYQQAREPVLTKLTAAALMSANWYERFGEHMALDPWPFALSYLLRAQRLSLSGLHDLAPEFARGLEQHGVSLEAG